MGVSEFESTHVVIVAVVTNPKSEKEKNGARLEILESLRGREPPTRVDRKRKTTL